MRDGVEKFVKFYLEDHAELVTYLRDLAEKVASEIGCGPLVINHDMFREATLKFQRECLAYWVTGMRVKEPSHLKFFGHLLYSLTQSQNEAGERLIFFGLLPENCKHLEPDDQYQGVYFHEFCCFVIVDHMFRWAQRLRDEDLSFDPLNPPSSRRYVRSMVDYIRKWPVAELHEDKTPFDFYMIFKTMDLYGLAENRPPSTSA